MKIRTKARPRDMVALIHSAMSGDKVDFSKKVFGVPQYMWTVISTMFYIAWESNRKK